MRGRPCVPLRSSPLAPSRSDRRSAPHRPASPRDQLRPDRLGREPAHRRVVPECTRLFRVGQAGVTRVVEHWNGKTWSVASSPNVIGSTLAAVSCSRPTICFAVGSQARRHARTRHSSSGGTARRGRSSRAPTPRARPAPSSRRRRARARRSASRSASQFVAAQPRRRRSSSAGTASSGRSRRARIRRTRDRSGSTACRAPRPRVASRSAATT